MGDDRQRVGTHLVLDLDGLDASVLDAIDVVSALLAGAATRGGAKVVDTRFQRFEPQGLSGIVVLAESHVTVHTWPELGYAAIDVFTCGDGEVGRRVAEEIVGALRPRSSELRVLPRGPRREAP